MAKVRRCDSGWWKLTTNIDTNQLDEQHIAERIIQGYTQGQIIHFQDH